MWEKKKLIQEKEVRGWVGMEILNEKKKMGCVFPSSLSTCRATGKLSGLQGFLLSESFQHLTVLGYIGNVFASFSYAVIFMSEADSLTIILIMSCSSSKSCTNIKELSGRLEENHS